MLQSCRRISGVWVHSILANLKLVSSRVLEYVSNQSTQPSQKKQAQMT